MEELTTIQVNFCSVGFKWTIKGVQKFPWADEGFLMSNEVLFERTDIGENISCFIKFYPLVNGDDNIFVFTFKDTIPDEKVITREIYLGDALINFSGLREFKMVVPNLYTRPYFDQKTDTLVLPFKIMYHICSYPSVPRICIEKAPEVVEKQDTDEFVMVENGENNKAEKLDELIAIAEELEAKVAIAKEVLTASIEVQDTDYETDDDSVAAEAQAYYSFYSDDAKSIETVEPEKSDNTIHVQNEIIYYDSDDDFPRVSGDHKSLKKAQKAKKSEELTEKAVEAEEKWSCVQNYDTNDEMVAAAIHTIKSNAKSIETVEPKKPENTIHVQNKKKYYDSDDDESPRDCGDVYDVYEILRKAEKAKKSEKLAAKEYEKNETNNLLSKIIGKLSPASKDNLKKQINWITLKNASKESKDMWGILLAKHAKLETFFEVLLCADIWDFQLQKELVVKDFIMSRNLKQLRESEGWKELMQHPALYQQVLEMVFENTMKNNAIE